jgi:hypothetical protein
MVATLRCSTMAGLPGTHWRAALADIGRVAELDDALGHHADAPARILLRRRRMTYVQM